MAVDYDEALAVVQELIEESGRQVTFIRFKQTPEDANKPWNGPDDPDGTPDAEETLWGVFVPPSGSNDLGLKAIDNDLLKRITAICLAAPKSAAPVFDITTANEVIDDSLHYKVEFVKMLKPADKTLLYIVGVSR